MSNHLFALKSILLTLCMLSSRWANVQSHTALQDLTTRDSVDWKNDGNSVRGAAINKPPTKKPTRRPSKKPTRRPSKKTSKAPTTSPTQLLVTLPHVGGFGGGPETFLCPNNTLVTEISSGYGAWINSLLIVCADGSDSRKTHFTSGVVFQYIKHFGLCASGFSGLSYSQAAYPYVPALNFHCGDWKPLGNDQGWIVPPGSSISAVNCPVNKSGRSGRVVGANVRSGDVIDSIELICSTA